MEIQRTQQENNMKKMWSDCDLKGGRVYNCRKIQFFLVKFQYPGRFTMAIYKHMPELVFGCIEERKASETLLNQAFRN
jgi:hypothetical protein